MSGNGPPPEGSTLAELIERTRGRARSLAGLVATATGAVIVGILFSPAADAFDVAASLLGGLAVILLLVCLTLLIYAQIVTKVTDQPKFPQTDDERALHSVRARTRDGLVVGGIALAMMCAMLAVVMVDRLTPEAHTTLHLSAEGSSRIKAVCPRIASMFVGTVSKAMRSAMQNDRIDVRVTADVCGSTEPVTLIIPTDDVVGWSD